MREVKYKKIILHVNSGIDNPNTNKMGYYYCLRNFTLMLLVKNTLMSHI